MLKLVFDEEVGFDDYYVVEKDAEFDLSDTILFYVNEIREYDDGKGPLESLTPEIEREWFDKYEKHPRKLINLLDIECIIDDGERETASHTIFKDICRQEGGEMFNCGYFKMKNPRLRLDYPENPENENKIESAA